MSRESFLPGKPSHEWAEATIPQKKYAKALGIEVTAGDTKVTLDQKIKATLLRKKMLIPRYRLKVLKNIYKRLKDRGVI